MTKLFFYFSGSQQYFIYIYIYIYFFLKNIKDLTHTHGEMGEGLKETDSDVYLKYPNSWIHDTDFKPL